MLVMWGCVVACVASACASEVGGEASPPVAKSECVIASVHSDYVSTSISLLRDDGTLCADRFVDSGSVGLDVVAALSGDVTLPSTAEGTGRLVLVDRYPHAVLTFVNPDAPQEVEQLSVATGFPSNPQDVAFLGDGRAYVARHASNGAAGGQDAQDAGGDLLILDMEELVITGRIPLSAEDGFDPMPSRMIQLREHVWVALSHLSRDFSRAGPGRLIGVDPARDVVTTVITLDGLENCGSIEPDLDGQGVWVACSGLFASGEQGQIAASALVYLSEDGGTLVEQWRTPTTEMLESPVAFSVASVGPQRAVFTVFGSIDAQTPDRLLWADADAETVNELGIEGSAFELGGVLYEQGTGVLLLADANPAEPLIRRFEVGQGQLSELAPVAGSPSTGLPPRRLQRFR
ncbi:MAG: hypothetical protein ACPGU1_17620 [Myxococcota bacterium]